MNYLDNDIYEFNKIDAYNKLQKAIENILGENKEKNFNKFMSLCKMSALQGNSHAQYVLGIFYEDGIGVEVDYEKSISLYEEAASYGLEEAIEKLGSLKNEI